jgi:hypothetical protein
MTEKLLPCPFCGVAPIPYRGEVIVTVGCDNNECPARECYCSMPLAYETEAIAAWNRRTPAPEGDVVAWRFRSKDGYGDWSHSNDEPTYLDSRAYDVQPLYASPVVPVGVSREEQRPLAEAIYRQVEPLLAECSEPNPEDYIDAIIAALRPTDTGREA